MPKLTLEVATAEETEEIMAAVESDYGLPATTEGVRQFLMDRVQDVVRSYREKQARAAVNATPLDIT